MLSKLEYKLLKRIGENVRKHRILNNMSQSQLAFETNISLRQLQRIESGTANAALIYYYRIADCFQISIEELIRIAN